MASDKIKQSSDSNFQSDVLAASSSTPVVVDFWATWCGPCRAMAPHLETLANELDGRVQIVKVDVDHNPNVAATHGIRGLPTLLVFKDGAVVDQLVGNPGSLGKLRDFIGKHA